MAFEMVGLVTFVLLDVVSEVIECDVARNAKEPPNPATNRTTITANNFVFITILATSLVN